MKYHHILDESCPHKSRCRTVKFKVRTSADEFVQSQSRTKESWGEGTVQEKCPVMKHLLGPNYTRLRKLLPLGTAALRAEQCVSYSHYTRREGHSFYWSNSFGVDDLSALSHEGVWIIKQVLHTCMTAQVKERTNAAELLSRELNSSRDSSI